MTKLDIIYLLACKQKTDGLDTYRGEAVPFSPKAVGGPIVYRSMPSVLKTVFIIQEKVWIGLPVWPLLSCTALVCIPLCDGYEHMISFLSILLHYLKLNLL